MNVLVTGGAGFIGSHVVDELLGRGVTVTVIDDLSTGFLSNLPLDAITFVEGSIVNGETVRRAMRNIDAVVHLAALVSVPRSIEDPQLSASINLTGTLNVLESARDAGCSTVVLASSAAVYGNSDRPVQSEDDACFPLSPYGTEKLANEGYARSFNQAFSMRNVCYRFFNVYGPRQLPDHEYAAVLPKFIGRALHGEPLSVHGDGEQSRDFVFVTDVARILSSTVLGDCEPHDLVYNLAFGDVHSVNAVAHHVLTATGSTDPIVHAPPRPGDIRSSRANHHRLASLFPEFRPTAFADGVATTAAWLSNALANRQIVESSSPREDQTP